ncbi:LPS O-antigen chain length determinant protein WzzB [Enterobacter ludwigii]|uniref:LPS O-antigen chain length determinant protein WzzB n=1 Tax=Enterobacter ludwigii TaxID=299767 RepID=UPI003BEEDCE4
MSTLPVHQPSAGEIDLLQLARTLWQGRRTFIFAILLGVAASGLAGHFGAWTWTSEAVLVAPSLTDNPALALQRASLKTLGITPDVTDSWLSGRFIRTFSARDVQLDFLQTSPVFQGMTAGLSAPARMAAENAMIQGMVLEPAPEGKGEKTLYPYLTARLKAKTAPQARQLLDDWLVYVNARVATMARQTLEEQRRVHLEAVREQLGLARTREAIARQVSVTRLGYALSLAKAAGISQPVFTKGDAFHDDPDFPLGLGEKGLSRKLEIYSDGTDLRRLSVTLQEQEDLVRRLESIPVTTPSVQAFHLLSSPVLPERHDGPQTVLLMVLGALAGGFIAAGVVLLRSLSHPQAGTRPAGDRTALPAIAPCPVCHIPHRQDTPGTPSR